MCVYVMYVYIYNIYVCIIYYIYYIFFFLWGVNRMVRHDSISILIPSDTIFADTSNYDSIQEHIN